MNITLFSRRNGLYQETNSTDIAGNRSDYFDGEKFNEQKLLDALPENFLPTKPKGVMVTVEVNFTFSRGIKNVSIFKKYSDADAYVLDIGF